MKTLLLAAALALSVTTAVPAPRSPWPRNSYPAEMLGVWCQVETSVSWVFFERGNCTGAVNSIVLSANGDYVRIAPLSKLVTIEERCKAIQNSSFKGWTDYVCTIGNMTEKRNQKWTTYTTKLTGWAWLVRIGRNEPV